MPSACQALLKAKCGLAVKRKKWREIGNPFQKPNFYPPTQKATGVSPWMNARSGYPPKPWRRRVCFGGLRRNMGEEATAVKPWSFTGHPKTHPPKFARREGWTLEWMAGVPP